MTLDWQTIVLIIIAGVLIGRSWRHLVRVHRTIRRTIKAARKPATPTRRRRRRRPASKASTQL